MMLTQACFKSNNASLWIPLVQALCDEKSSHSACTNYKLHWKQARNHSVDERTIMNACNSEQLYHL